jgi:cell wall-associated NlpC family hydrolase
MPEPVRAYKSFAVRAARRYHVPVPLFFGLIRQESGWSQRAGSSAGAVGLAQIMPSSSTHYNIHNWKQNLLAGAAELASDLRSYHGNRRLALAAYNAGPGAVAKYHGVPPYAETRAYIPAVLRYAAQYNRQMPRGGLGLIGGSQGRTRPGRPAIPGSPGTPGLPAQTIQGNDQLFQLMQSTSQSLGLPPLSLPPPSITIPGVKPLKPVAAIGPGHQVTVATDGGKITPRDRKVVQLAHKYLGVPYVWGGQTPKGFDCAGFIRWIWSHAGVNLPSGATNQLRWGLQHGRKVSLKKLRPGDLIGFYPGEGPGGAGSVGHIGLYIGGGKFIHAPHTGDVVKISPLSGHYRSVASYAVRIG